MGACGRWRDFLKTRAMVCRLQFRGFDIGASLSLINLLLLVASILGASEFSRNRCYGGATCWK
ncbi:hypothetical protein OCAR_6842 [Afipia carboxidovorans OM5]|nr:hypothetical protein OCAR_6842 [Afipia carboxidovorans OM5]